MSERSKKSGLAGALFTGTQQRVLGLLFGHPERSFYASEVISRAPAGSGAVQRELARLEAAGLITARRIGSQKHYQANAQSPLFKELRSIVRRTVGLVEPLRQALAPFASKIASAFVYGSVASRTDTAQSDVDLMIVSDHVTYADIFRALESTSVSLGLKINPTVYSPKEFEKRIKDRNAFVTKVLKLTRWNRVNAISIGHPRVFVARGRADSILPVETPGRRGRVRFKSKRRSVRRLHKRHSE